MLTRVSILLLVLASPPWARQEDSPRARKGDNMAVIYWTNAAGNYAWSTAGNWSGGAVPVNNDDVVFDGNVCDDPVTSGLAQSAVDLDSLHTMSSYSANIGFPGNGLDIAADVMLIEGGGEFYHKYTGGGSTDFLVVNSISPTLALLTDGAVRELVAIRGKTILGSAFGWLGGINYVLVGYADDPSDGAEVVNNAATAAVIVMLQIGGIIDTTRVVDANYIGGGLYHRHSGPNGESDGYDIFGGRVLHESDDVSSLRLLGGVMDLSGDPRARMISTARIFPGATFIPNGNTTITAGGSVVPGANVVAVSRTWTNTDADGDWDNPNNWSGTATSTSIRTAALKWTASGHGVNEYYVDLLAGGNPSITDPDSVTENDVAMTHGTVGSLDAGEWDYGDNDALGYDTVYVRLTDSADPDGKAVGWVKKLRIRPDTGDAAIFDGTCTDSVTLGLDQTAVNLAVFRTYPAYSGDIGTSVTSLEANCDYVAIEGKGTVYYDHSGAGSTDMMVVNSANQDDALIVDGEIGTFIALRGAITCDTDFDANAVTIGHIGHPSSDVYITNNSVNTLASVTMSGGTFDSTGDVTYGIIGGGSFIRRGTGGAQVAGYWLFGGRIDHRTGGIARVYVMAGTLDCSKANEALTITKLRVMPSGEYMPGSNVTVTDGGDVLPLQVIQP